MTAATPPPTTTTTTTTPPTTVTFLDLRTVRIEHAGLYSLVVQNSDHFLTLLSLTVSSMTALTDDVRSHGLIGQTWRADQHGAEVAEVDGYVDDYVLLDGQGDGHEHGQHAARDQLLGCAFVYSQMEC